MLSNAAWEEVGRSGLALLESPQGQRWLYHNSQAEQSLWTCPGSASDQFWEPKLSPHPKQVAQSSRAAPRSPCCHTQNRGQRCHSLGPAARKATVPHPSTLRDHALPPRPGWQTQAPLSAENIQIKQQRETIWQREADLTAPQEYLHASHPPEPHCQHSQPPPLPASIPPSIGGEKQRGCKGAEGWRRDGGSISCGASTAPGCEASSVSKNFFPFCNSGQKFRGGNYDLFGDGSACPPPKTAFEAHFCSPHP